MSLYMVIERFSHPDAVPVYRRFRDRGRLAPPGLTYVSSWVTPELDRCYQVMQKARPARSMDQQLERHRRLRNHTGDRLKRSS